MAGVTGDILNQIDELKTHINENHNNRQSVKVLQNTDNLIVKFNQFLNFNMNLTIQLPADLDLTKVIICVTCTKASQPVLKSEELQHHLNDYIYNRYNDKDHKNKNIFISLFNEACLYVKEHLVQTETEKNKNKDKKKAHNSRNSDSDEDVTEKKCSMKTSTDVLNRIMWDNEINKEFITVGYLDRFLGIKECPFSDFDWGDIVNADLGALAIPKHRINYFKYKNEIIWNKNTRFDNVFGSTGSNETIIDVIRRLENERFTKDEENEEPAHRLGRANRNVKNQKNQPNYFVSIPIRNKAIIDRLFDLNCDLLDSNIKIEKYILPSSSYHLTLCTLKINNDDEKSEVCQILKNVLKSEQVKQKFPITLSFKDVGEFYNKVFYVKSDSTNEIDKLDFIRRLVLAEFEKNQISTAGNYYEFVPHLTVFKIKKEKQVIDTDTVMTLVNDKIWTNYRGVEFGSEELNEFELCRMGGDIMVDKTYPVEFKYCLN